MKYVFDCVCVFSCPSELFFVKLLPSVTAENCVSLDWNGWQFFYPWLELIFWTEVKISALLRLDIRGNRKNRNSFSSHKLYLTIKEELLAEKNFAANQNYAENSVCLINIHSRWPKVMVLNGFLFPELMQQMQSHFMFSCRGLLRRLFYVWSPLLLNFHFIPFTLK